MAEQVLARVVYGKTSLESTPVHYKDGTLPGYTRYKLKGRDYPGIMPDKEGKVLGKLVLDVDGQAMDRLDYFEAEEYTRELLEVETDDGPVEAWAYVWKEKRLVVPEEWDFDDFRQTKMHKWVVDELGEDDGLGGRFWTDYDQKAQA